MTKKYRLFKACSYFFDIRLSNSRAFDTLDNLIFIEADSMNAEYRSANGVLYNRDGSITAYPNRLVRPDDMYRKRNKIRLNNH